MGARRLDADGGPDQGEAMVTWELPADPRMVSQARALTRETLGRWRVSDPVDVDDVVLMVDELITNAVLHGRGPVRFRLLLNGRLLTGEVGDASRAVPRGGGVHWRSEAGRGLGLVTALAHDFGARDDAPGKTVWFSRLLTVNGSAGRPPAASSGTAAAPAPSATPVTSVTANGNGAT